MAKAKTRALKGWQEIASFLGQPLPVAQRWAKSGMPVTRDGGRVHASPEELTRWLGHESAGEPVQIASDSTDLSSELKRGLSYVRKHTPPARGEEAGGLEFRDDFPSSFLHREPRFHPPLLALWIMRDSNFGVGDGFRSILRDMAEKKTDRSACRFTVQQARDGKPFLAVQLYRDTVPLLREVSFGFGLLRGTQVEEAKKLAEMLNERVLDMFVTMGEKHPRHRDGAGSWNSPISALRAFGLTIEPPRVKTGADSGARSEPLLR